MNASLLECSWGWGACSLFRQPVSVQLVQEESLPCSEPQILDENQIHLYNFQTVSMSKYVCMYVVVFMLFNLSK